MAIEYKIPLDSSNSFEWLPSKYSYLVKPGILCRGVSS